MSKVMYQSEERAALLRQLSDQAIKQALASKWDEAVQTNRQILESFPRDLSTLNRLGKALSELGQYGDSRQAYSEALEVDPANTIAKKNLDRLAQLGDGATKKTAAERIDPRLFIEETGKTGFSSLVEVAPRAVLAKLSAGEQVYLKPEGKLVYVQNAEGDRIGRIEARLASRLIKFMDGGNQYAAGIVELRGNEVRVIIRETFQDPSQFGKVSFPSSGGGEHVRAYIKDTMVRYGRDEDDEDNEDDLLEDEGDESEEGENQEVEESDYLEPEE